MIRNHSLIILFSLSSLSPIWAQEPQIFGETADSQSAIDFTQEFVKIYKSNGTPSAIKHLEKAGIEYIDNSTATERFDFFSMVKDEAIYRAGYSDLKFRGAILEWIYNYGRYAGEDYWYRDVIPPLYDHYAQTGHYAKAREILTYEVNRLAEDKNTDVEISRLKEGGFIEKDFPEFRRKYLPKSMINYRYHILQGTLAKQDLAEGKWRRAIEEANITKKKGFNMATWASKRPHLRDAKTAITQGVGFCRIGSSVIADAYQFIGIKELELREYESITNFGVGKGLVHQYIDIANAHVHHIRHSLGMESAEAAVDEITKSRKIVAKHSDLSKNELHLISLLIADVYFQSDNSPKGWELLNGLKNNPDLTFHTKSLVIKHWCRYRTEEGELDGVEAQLLSLLQTARQGGLKREEIDLYEIYSRFLIASGRLDQALQIQRELIRLLRTFDLFPRLPAALKGMAEIYALMGKDALAKTTQSSAREEMDQHTFPDGYVKRMRSLISKPLPEAKKQHKGNVTAKTDFQPRSAIVTPLAGLPARGLFTLKNHSETNQSGKLTLKGKGLHAKQDNQGDLIHVDALHGSGQDELSFDLDLTAGSTTYLDLEIIEKDATSKPVVAIIWKSNNGPSIQSQWQAMPPEKGTTLAIVDAANYLENPFYLIPVYHLIQYKDDFEQALDLRIIASQKTRIEIYDHEDKLVAVDADGDGSTTGQGDMTAQDFNRNGLPDMRLRSGEHENRFRFFVRPEGAIPEEGMTLTLEIKVEGKWVTIAQDKLLPNSK